MTTTAADVMELGATVRYNGQEGTVVGFGARVAGFHEYPIDDYPNGLVIKVLVGRYEIVRHLLADELTRVGRS